MQLRVSELTHPTQAFGNLGEPLPQHVRRPLDHSLHSAPTGSSTRPRRYKARSCDFAIKWRARCAELRHRAQTGQTKGTYQDDDAGRPRLITITGRSAERRRARISQTTPLTTFSGTWPVSRAATCRATRVRRLVRDSSETKAAWGVTKTRSWRKMG
jgi:hypothetical protein